MKLSLVVMTSIKICLVYWLHHEDCTDRKDRQPWVVHGKFGSTKDILHDKVTYEALTRLSFEASYIEEEREVGAVCQAEVPRFRIVISIVTRLPNTLYLTSQLYHSK